MAQTSSSIPQMHTCSSGQWTWETVSLNWSFVICWAVTPEVGISLRATADPSSTHKVSDGEEKQTRRPLNWVLWGEAPMGLPEGAPVPGGTAWGAVLLTSLGHGEKNGLVEFHKSRLFSFRGLKID